MDKRLIHYEFPRDQIQLDGTTAELHAKVAAVVEDTTDAAIVAAILAAARAEEVTDLYLMDKTFILDALREKLERENPKPLTIEDLIKMQDQAVWVQPNGDPLNGHWGVVEGASESKGKKYLYLWGNPFSYIIDEDYEAYRHRPKEVPHGK